MDTESFELEFALRLRELAAVAVRRGAPAQVVLDSFLIATLNMLGETLPPAQLGAQLVELGERLQAEAAAQPDQLQ